MTKCMSYREGERRFDIIELAKSKSILREHLRSPNPDATQIPFLYIYIFYKNINYLYVHWKHLARRFQ